ncbi:MAG: T9SS type A sorting domain-containing protein, partial [candidate division WOR-3 bacterium]
TELDCEVINDEPWVVHHDLNWANPDSAGFWIFHAEGSPGNWTWEIFDIHELGACSIYIDDTLFYCSPGQYPSVAYEPTSNTILIAYKADFLKVCGTDTLYAGPHIGGIYSVDNGMTWTVSAPLSDTHVNEIPWGYWSATEVAHRLVNIDGCIYSCAVWVDELTLGIYFEKGMVRPFVPLGIDEYSNSAACAQFHAAPTIARDNCAFRFSLSAPTITVIELYDATGRFVKKVFDGYCDTGTHEFDIGLSGMPAGIYFVRLQAGEHTHMTKIIVAR